MLTVILCGGKSKGESIDSKEDDSKIGSLIEKEHVDMFINNPVISAIENVFIEKIKNDHLTENENYYVNGANFRDELKKEN